MKLKNLLKGVRFNLIEPSVLEKDVGGIATDHRKVKKGDVFFALKGEKFDGNDFVNDAIKAGASVVISDQKHYLQQAIKVENARSAYAIMSKHFYGDVCDKLKIIAVTGTNGKTTTANTIADILTTAGKKVGVIGTMGAYVGDEVVDTGLTTPDPDKLHQLFQRMQQRGDEYVVMEASAHALALNKLDGITFEVGVLTNITEDHLDFFGNMENYARAKFKLFEQGRVKKGVICCDKVFDENLLKLVEVPYLSYGFGVGKDLKASNISKSFSGSRFLCEIDGDLHEFKTPLVGSYNVENVLAAIGVCQKLGIDVEEIKKGVGSTLPVEGRFNVIKFGGVNVVIDFAHTPDGLEKVLLSARDLARNKLTVVFGCGGNRDKLKRPIMGKIASTFADQVVLTSDNPRFEKPLDIIAEINSGVTNGNAIIIENRKKAIEHALRYARPGETIIIAGKGGEKYQEIGGVKYKYNDYDVVSDFYRNEMLSRKRQLEKALVTDDAENDLD